MVKINFKEFRIDEIDEDLLAAKKRLTDMAEERKKYLDPTRPKSLPVKYVNVFLKLILLYRN